MRVNYNNSNNNKNNSSGIGFFGLLAIVFITLKLLGIITWSWLWVLSPLWGATLLVMLIVLIIFAVAGLK